MNPRAEMSAPPSTTGAPCMTPEDIEEHLGLMDRHVLSDLHAFVPPADRTQKAEVIKFLKVKHPHAFEALQDIERAWVCAYDLAYEQRAAIFRAYGRFAQLLYAKKEEDDRVDKAKPPKVRETLKRSRALVEEKEDVEFCDVKNKQTWYTKRELWSDLYHVQDFREHTTRKEVPQLENYAVFKTIYHCPSIWAMEQLADILEREHHVVVSLKAQGIPADLDMLRWKVVTSEPLEPVIK